MKLPDIYSLLLRMKPVNKIVVKERIKYRSKDLLDELNLYFKVHEDMVTTLARSLDEIALDHGFVNGKRSLEQITQNSKKKFDDIDYKNVNEDRIDRFREFILNIVNGKGDIAKEFTGLWENMSKFNAVIVERMGDKYKKVTPPTNAKDAIKYKSLSRSRVAALGLCYADFLDKERFIFDELKQLKETLSGINTEKEFYSMLVYGDLDVDIKNVTLNLRELINQRKVALDSSMQINQHLFESVDKLNPHHSRIKTESGELEQINIIKEVTVDEIRDAAERRNVQDKSLSNAGIFGRSSVVERKRDAERTMLLNSLISGNQENVNLVIGDLKKQQETLQAMHLESERTVKAFIDQAEKAKVAGNHVYDDVSKADANRLKFVVESLNRKCVSQLQVKLSIAADSNDVKIRRIDATKTDIKLLYNIYRKKKICNKVNKIFAALSITYFACLSVLLGYFKQMAFSQIISGAMFASGVASPLGIVSLGLVALLATWSVVSGYCLYRYQHAKASILKPKVEKLTLKNSFKLIPTPSSLFARVFKATQKNRPVEVGAAVAVSASSQAELGGCSRV